MTVMANQDLFMQSNAVNISDLLDRAQRYCATAEHCPADVRQLLLRHGANNSQADEVIELLQQQNYLNDERYCMAFVHDKVAFQAWGRIKILAALRAKQLPDSCIHAALQNIDDSVYADNIRKLLRSKRGQDKQKVMRFMLQRGFSYDDLRQAAEYETDD